MSIWSPLEKWYLLKILIKGSSRKTGEFAKVNITDLLFEKVENIKIVETFGLNQHQVLFC